MGRVAGAVLGTLTGPVSGFVIGGKDGALRGLANATAALSGPVAFGVYVVSQAFAAAQSAQKPDTAEGQLKTSLAPRIDAFGTSRLYPAITCYETAPDGSAVDVGAICEGWIDSIVQPYLNDDKVTVTGGVVQALADKSYQGGNVRMGWSLGAPTETAFAPVVAAIPDRWTNDHRGDGVVTGYLIKRPEKDKYFLETYPQGDNVQFSLAGRWKRVFDWRDPAQSPTDPSTWQWSDNPVLCFVWYLMVRRSFDWTTRLAPQLARLTAAANDCDVAMPLAAGGTEPRYRTSLSYKLTDAPAAITASFLACFDGWYDVNEEGEVVIYSGRYYAPTVSLGPREIAAFNVPYGMPVEDAVNEITVQYVSSEHDYNTVDATAWRDEAAIDASSREPNTTDLGAAIPSGSQGRRLAKRKMYRLRQAPITITTTIAGEDVIGERYVMVDLTEADTTFYAGPVEIITAPERNMQTGGVTFQCIPIGPEIDDWNTAEEGSNTPVVDRPEVASLPAPTITSVSYDYDQLPGYNTPGAKLTIVATSPDLPALQWYVRHRITGEAVWLERLYPDLDPGASVTLQTEFLPLAPLDVEVSYSASDGRVSPWVSVGAVNTGNVAPDALMGLSMTSDGASLFLDWNASRFAARYLVEVIPNG